jgi:hypothetical protein
MDEWTGWSGTAVVAGRGRRSWEQNVTVPAKDFHDQKGMQIPQSKSPADATTSVLRRGRSLMRVKFGFGMERIHEGLDEKSRGQISVDARMRADQLARIHMRRHQQKSLRRKSHPSAAPRRAGAGPLCRHAVAPAPTPPLACTDAAGRARARSGAAKGRSRAGECARHCLGTAGRSHQRHSGTTGAALRRLVPRPQPAQRQLR